MSHSLIMMVLFSHLTNHLMMPYCLMPFTLMTEALQSLSLTSVLKLLQRKEDQNKQLGSITITISHPYYLQIITKLSLALVNHRTIHLKNLILLHLLAIIFPDGTNQFHGQINNELPRLNQRSLGTKHHLDGTRIPLSGTILRCL